MDIEFDGVPAFIHCLTYTALPETVRARALDLLLDTLAVAASGATTPVSGIARRHAVRHMGGNAARLMFDGRTASVGGACFANATTIDSFDAHDGHVLTKGHMGVTVVPAILAFAEATNRLDGHEALAALVMGYEVATRAGIALHTEAQDYHTSGAWNALAAAAIGARYLRLDPAHTREAVGIAEYHGPRSQMMRCIDAPTMVKDGSGWGAFAGATAALLAEDGFTGAPAVTIEGAGHAALWGSLGQRWCILEQYVKPYPVCRWAQAPMEAVMGLRAGHSFAPEDVAEITVCTFDAAVRLGNRPVTTTEEAQYSTGFPLAALLVRGRVGAAEIAGDGLTDLSIAAMQARIRVQEDAEATRMFPAARSAVVELHLRDGRVLTSPRTFTRGDPDSPLDAAALAAKVDTLTEMLPAARRDTVREAVAGLAEGRSLHRLLDGVMAPCSDG